MELKEYQVLAMRTKGGLSDAEQIICGGLGIAGEAGEVADLIKKVAFHDHDLEVDKIKKELGDVMWYIALLCDALSLSMDEITEENIEKLKLRYPDGFSSERSKNRE